MLKRCVAIAILFGLTASVSSASPAAKNRATACSAWQANYSGILPESVSFLDGDERVDLSVREGIVLQISAKGVPGFFSASSRRMQCTADGVTSTLDDGFGGIGKISLRRAGNRYFLKIYNFRTGQGPNRAIFLPTRVTEIEIKR